MVAELEPLNGQKQDVEAAAKAQSSEEAMLQKPMKQDAEISEQEYQSLSKFIYQMVRGCRFSEIFFFVGLPVIGVTGAQFTTKEEGFPTLFYAGYVPLLLANKGTELYYVYKWRDMDPVAAKIQKEQWAACGFSHPVVHLLFGLMEHADLFLDVIFTSTAFACGFRMLGIASAVSLVLSTVVQLLTSYVWPESIMAGRNVYTTLLKVWLSCQLQGMSWLAEVCIIARFGELEKVDKRFTTTHNVVTILCEQLPQMVFQALYFRWCLHELESQARWKQWLSVTVSICVMLNKARQETCLFAVPCILTSIAVAAIMLPAELHGSEVVWV
mmetsp:Transcript_24279/g.45917  ORF Transcript_24279/g.45917 Transcript_24279/m.45917 type:complete len:327 (+) Transcript_24279:57-1037(+)